MEKRLKMLVSTLVEKLYTKSWQKRMLAKFSNLGFEQDLVLNSEQLFYLGNFNPKVQKFIRIHYKGYSPKTATKNGNTKESLEFQQSTKPVQESKVSARDVELKRDCESFDSASGCVGRDNPSSNPEMRERPELSNCKAMSTITTQESGSSELDSATEGREQELKRREDLTSAINLALTSTIKILRKDREYARESRKLARESRALARESRALARQCFDLAEQSVAFATATVFGAFDGTATGDFKGVAKSGFLAVDKIKKAIGALDEKQQRMEAISLNPETIDVPAENLDD